jgi:hypothetical protein
LTGLSFNTKEIIKRIHYDPLLRKAYGTFAKDSLDKVSTAFASFLISLILLKVLFMTLCKEVPKLN